MTNSKEGKVFHVVGFDFDGCLLPERDLQESIVKHNEALIEAMKKQRKAYCGRLMFLTSSRQSYAIDQGNRQNQSLPASEDPSSAFLPLIEIAKACNAVHSPLLLADIYGEKPEGYAYRRAIDRASDPSAYHPGFVFDDMKTSLIYLQAHTAANHLINCDFLELKKADLVTDSENIESILKSLPFRSNAAYVYLSDENEAYYVNKVEDKVQKLQINNQDAFNTFLAKCRDRIRYLEHDFESKYDRKKGCAVFIHGITLSPEAIELMGERLGHTHRCIHYRIIFDFFDDSDLILETLSRIYNQQLALLPENVMIRLHHYDASLRVIGREKFVLCGEGPIDTKPGATVLAMAKSILKKPLLTDEDFHKSEGGNDKFSKWIASAVDAESEGDSHKIFDNRATLPVPPFRSLEIGFACIHDFSFVLNPVFVEKIRQYLDKGEPVFSVGDSWEKGRFLLKSLLCHDDHIFKRYLLNAVAACANLNSDVPSPPKAVKELINEIDQYYKKNEVASSSVASPRGP